MLRIKQCVAFLGIEPKNLRFHRQKTIFRNSRPLVGWKENCNFFKIYVIHIEPIGVASDSRLSRKNVWMDGWGPFLFPSVRPGITAVSFFHYLCYSYIIHATAN